MNGIIYINDFIANSSSLFDWLRDNIEWDDRMSARKTASFGKAYNYSQMTYPYQAFIPKLSPILEVIEDSLDYKPNNCLINYYLNGKSKMGFHSDQTDILAKDTGVGILSLGETRILRFRNIKDRNIIVDYELPSGSFIHMSNDVQAEWQHAIPKSETDRGRMSLTFRKLI